MIRIILITLFFFSGCIEVGQFKSTTYSGERFIVKGKDVHIRSELKGLVRDLKHSDGFVAYLTPLELTRLRLLGISVVKDNLIQAYTGCENLPAPPPEVPTGGDQVIPWGIEAVRAPEAWTVTRGAGVLVCVVDTGVDKQHEDLQGQIVGGSSYYNNDYQDDNGHGTHVSGTILAVDNSIGVIGVAPESKLFSVKALDGNGSGWDSDISDGILDCVHANSDIINLSLGSSSPSSTIENAIDQAVAAGVIVVAAAGNSSTQTGYPAARPNVISVSAVDYQLRLANFSNYGKIEYAAPGVDILSTVAGGYSKFNGTSMASPHVAGIYALALAAGRQGIDARDIGLSNSEQGLGFADAERSVD